MPTDDAPHRPAVIGSQATRQRDYIVFSILAWDYADENVLGKIRRTCSDGRAACNHPAVFARAFKRTCNVTGEQMLFVRASKKGENVFLETMRAYGIDNLFRDRKISKRDVHDQKTRYREVTLDSCLHIAVACRFRAALRWLLAIPDIDPNAHVHIQRAFGPYHDIYALRSLIPCTFLLAQTVTFRLTSMHIAAGIDDCEALKTLAAAGADPSYFSNDCTYSFTPLHTAVENWNEHAIACLVDELRVDPNARRKTCYDRHDSYSWTPIECFMFFAYINWAMPMRSPCTWRTLSALVRRGASLRYVLDIMLARFVSTYLRCNPEEVPYSFSYYCDVLKRHDFRWHHQKLIRESGWYGEEEVRDNVRSLLCCAIQQRAHDKLDVILRHFPATSRQRECAIEYAVQQGDDDALSVLSRPPPTQTQIQR